MEADLLEHPAVHAWRALGHTRVEPLYIEILKQKRKCSVYRLAGVGPGNRALIAKRYRPKQAVFERAIYQDILPEIPVSVPAYLGFLEGGKDTCWLFLEDVGDDQFSHVDETHRKVAARWLGQLHTEATRLIEPDALPDRGPRYYLDLLRSARRNILANLDNPALNDAHVEILMTIVEHCDYLESDWGRLALICEVLPYTMVHGDFRSKNVRVRNNQGEITLWPLDWEYAGWGTPAPDLAPAHRDPTCAQIDLQVYLASVREYWTDLDLTTLQHMAMAGFYFRLVAAIYWASTGLKFSSLEKSVGSMRVYRRELSLLVPLTTLATSYG